MLRRSPRLILVLLILAMSGCVVYPGHGWHDHRYYGGGPGYYHHW